MTADRPADVPGGTPPLTCRELVEIITDYLEGELDPDTASRFEAHLEVCPGCQIYVEQMRETISLLGRVPPDRLPETTVAGLMDAFRALRPPG